MGKYVFESRRRSCILFYFSSPSFRVVFVPVKKICCVDVFLFVPDLCMNSLQKRLISVVVEH